MRITKRQLRRIIKEDREGMTGFVSQIPPGVSLENAEYEQGYNDAIAGLPPDLEWEGRSYSDRRDLDSYEAGYESGQGEMANEGLVRITKRQLRRIIREQLLLEGEESTLAPKMGDGEIMAAAESPNLKGRLTKIAIGEDWSKLKLYVDRYGPWNFLEILELSATGTYNDPNGWADRAAKKMGPDKYGKESTGDIEFDAKRAVEKMIPEWFRSNVLQSGDEKFWELLEDMIADDFYDYNDFLTTIAADPRSGKYVVVPEMDLATASKMLPYIEENDSDFIDSGIVPEHLTIDTTSSTTKGKNSSVFPWELERLGTTMADFAAFLERMRYVRQEFKPPKKKRKRHLKPPTLTKQQWNAVLNGVSKSGEGGRYRQSSISQDDAMAGFEKYAKKYMLQDVYDGKVFTKVYDYAESRGIGARWGAEDYTELDQLRQEDHDYAYGQ
jgi:hypothetical protein